MLSRSCGRGRSEEHLSVRWIARTSVGASAEQEIVQDGRRCSIEATPLWRGDDNGGGNDKIDKDRLLRMRDVVQIVGVSDKTIYRLMKEGLFPRSVRIGPNSVAWRKSDIIAWIADLPPANEDSANAR